MGWQTMSEPFENTVLARAHANIALIKYWGKRDSKNNLPAVPSLSLTIDNLYTDVSVTTGPDKDSFFANEKPLEVTAATRVVDFLDTLWAQANKQRPGLTIKTTSTIPMASGLASSSAVFAAIAVAANKLLKAEWTGTQLSALARIGSGSAARSIFGGLVEMSADTTNDFAKPLSTQWPELRMIIATVCGGVKKTVSSRDAMELCKQTSPYYSAWVEQATKDVATAKLAIGAKLWAQDHGLGQLMEANALAMHAAMMSSRPPVVYWRPTTLQCMETVYQLRKNSVPAFFTMDAGPHVKVVTLSKYAHTVFEAMQNVPEVEALLCAPGPAARILSSGNKDTV